MTNLNDPAVQAELHARAEAGDRGAQALLSALADPRTVYLRDIEPPDVTLPFTCCDHGGCTDVRNGHEDVCAPCCNSGGHTIEWTLAPETIDVTVTCQEPEGADCRRWCRCEKVPPAGVEHCPVCGEVVAQDGDCNPRTWIENSEGWIAHYGGPKVSLHDGPVTFTWDGDDWLWNYT